jgi:CHASE1-domain containing sensor protein
MFASLTLKQKILATVILAVALSCLLVGYFSQRSAQQLIETRMFEQELPNLTQRIGKEIEKDLTRSRAPPDSWPMTASCWTGWPAACPRSRSPSSSTSSRT